MLCIVCFLRARRSTADQIHRSPQPLSASYFVEHTEVDRPPLLERTFVILLPGLVAEADVPPFALGTELVLVAVQLGAQRGGGEARRWLPEGDAPDDGLWTGGHSKLALEDGLMERSP